jgi:hypothetical protein
MNPHRTCVAALVFFGFGISLTPVLGGSVITANLPPNTAIVNVNATQDGSAAFNSGQSLWYSPFTASGGTLPQYTIQPGTYRFQLVNPEDAMRMFPALTQAQTNQIYTGWTYNSPWITDYLVFDSSAVTNNSIYQLFDGAPNPTSYGNGPAAYAGAVSGGFSDKIRSGPDGRNGKILTDTYTFSQETTLVFVVPDYGLYDNAGGVSVVVSPGIARPALTIGRQSEMLVLRWPTNSVDFILEEKTNLSSGDWVEVSVPPSVAGENYSVGISPTATSLFFRLNHP